MHKELGAFDSLLASQCNYYHQNTSSLASNSRPTTASRAKMRIIVGAEPDTYLPSMTHKPLCA